MGLRQGHQQAGDEQVDDGHREHEGPGEAHQLVVAEARQRRREPRCNTNRMTPTFAANQNSGSRIGCNDGNQEEPGERPGTATPTTGSVMRSNGRAGFSA